MKTNIEIEDSLLEEAMKIEASKTKKEIIHEALTAYVQYLKRQSILNYFGKVKWEGNLDEMRTVLEP